VTYVTRADWATDAAPRAPFDIAGDWRGEIHDAAGVRRSGAAVAFAFALFRHFVRRRRSYDLVVVAALPVLNVFAVRMALLGTRTRLVVDWLEVWPARKWRAYAGASTGTVAWVLQAAASRVGDILTVNSMFTRDRLRGHRRPSSDPILLGLVDLVGEDPDASSAVPGTPSALFVGRHIADKRLAALPPAIAVARESLPGLRALVVGSGPETEAVRAAAREAGVDAAVEFLGRVDEATLRRLFRESSVLVNPSAREGFGLVVAEAAAAATPSVVVAGEDNAAAALVQDGVNGTIAADVSPRVLADAITRVVRAGAPLRESTLEWFRGERAEHGLDRAVDRILERYAALAVGRRRSR
jgi:glycosyltransferase involved in cell wall biosynthesis